MPKLLVDNREPRKTIIDPLVKATDAEVVELGTGDFVIEDECGHMMAIERKEIKDLLHSIGSDRFRSQMARVTTFDHQMLIIEGFWSVNGNGQVEVLSNRNRWINTGWRGSNVQMILMGWQHHGKDLVVLHTANHADTIHTIEALWARAKKGCAMNSLKKLGC